MSKHLARAQQLLDARRFMDAAEMCKKALRKPAEARAARALLADCHYNQGVVHLFLSGLHADAEEHFRTALAHDPRHVEARNNLAGLFLQQGRLDEAIEQYREVLAQQPGRLATLEDLAQAYQRADRLDEASAVLLELADRTPQDSGLLLRDALLVQSVMPYRGYADEVRARILQRLAAIRATGRTVAQPARYATTYFYLSYHGLCNKDINRAIAQAWLAGAPSLAWQAPHIAAWRGPAARVRVGIASRYLFNHSIGHTSRGFVEMLDRSRFEAIVIHLDPVPADPIASAIDRAADRVVTVPVADLQQAREAIARLELDVLFWEDIGMDPSSYLLAFARLAPVQVTSYGHPDTTGIPNVDYFISSDLYETADAGEHYSETLVRLPDLGTLAYYHRPQIGPPMARASVGIADDEHLYLCPQTLFKIHPDMDDILLAIVQRDAAARIVLIEHHARHMRTALEQRMGKLSPLLVERLRFIKTLPHSEYLRLAAAADVVLDTPHFNGQNTSLEAFAAGAPVVTLPGVLQRSRHTYGMYRAMGFLDLVAQSKEDYAAKAVALATDAVFRERCRSRIAASCGVLFENAAFVRSCESALLELLSRASQDAQRLATLRMDSNSANHSSA